MAVGGADYDEADTDTYAGQLQAAHRKKEAASMAINSELEAERARVKQIQQHGDAARLQLQQRVTAAEAQAQYSTAQVAQLEAKRRSQESEIMQLIKVKEDLKVQQSSRDEEVSELNDQLYDATTKLEEVEDEKRELEEETAKLRAQAAEAAAAAKKQAAQLSQLQHELSEAVEQKERADKLLKQAIG